MGLSYEGIYEFYRSITARIQCIYNSKPITNCTDVKKNFPSRYLEDPVYRSITIAISGLHTFDDTAPPPVWKSVGVRAA